MSTPAHALRIALLLPVLAMSGCASLGEQPMTLARARQAANELAARHHPATGVTIAPFYSRKEERAQLVPTDRCHGKKLTTDFITLILRPSGDTANDVVGVEEVDGDCLPSSSTPVRGLFTSSKLFLFETGDDSVKYIYQYDMGKDKAGQPLLRRSGVWKLFRSLLAGEELTFSAWTFETGYDDREYFERTDYIPSFQDPRSSYPRQRIANLENLRSTRQSRMALNASIAQGAAEVRDKEMRAYQEDGPIDLATSIREHADANIAALNSINQAANQGRSRTNSTSGPSSYTSPTSSSASAAGPSSSSTTASAASAASEPSSYQDLCVTQGMQELVGHDYTDPAGYRGHCREWEFARYQGGDWLRHVQPGSKRPLTPWPSRQSACAAAQQEQVEFEKMRQTSSSARARPIVERSPCVCETGLQEFTRTANPNGWGCSIFFKEGG